MSDSLQPSDCSTPGSSIQELEFSSQEYWSRLLFPSPGDLPDPGIKPVSPEAPALQTDSLSLSHQGSPLSLRFINFISLANNQFWASYSYLHFLFHQYLLSIIFCFLLSLEFFKLFLQVTVYIIDFYFSSFLFKYT